MLSARRRCSGLISFGESGLKRCSVMGFCRREGKGGGSISMPRRRRKPAAENVCNPSGVRACADLARKEEGGSAPKRGILCGKRPNQGRHAVEKDGPEVSTLVDLLGVTGEAFFRAMLDALPQIAFVIRPDGTAEFYNRALRDFVAAPLGSDVQSRAALFHPEDRQRFVPAREPAAPARPADTA